METALAEAIKETYNETERTVIKRSFFLLDSIPTTPAVLCTINTLDSNKKFAVNPPNETNTKHSHIKMPHKKTALYES